MTKYVYLAGPIMYCDRAEANDWRYEVANNLMEGGLVGISPLRCEPLIGERIEGVLLPLEAESVLAKPAAGKGVFRGPPPRSGIDERLFRVLGRSYVREAAIFPVRIRDRVVNLLYVDNGTDPLGETSIGALSALCDCISRAYEGLILARNRRHC